MARRCESKYCRFWWKDLRGQCLKAVSKRRILEAFKAQWEEVKVVLGSGLRRSKIEKPLPQYVKSAAKMMLARGKRGLEDRID